MNFRTLLGIVSSEPIFSSGLLMTVGVNRADLHRQLSRWTKAGKIIQLRRGLYTLAEPYCKISPHPFLVANRLRSASYVSRQSALAYHGLIPEYVAEVNSVTTRRPERINNAIGRFDFRHIRKSFFYGFREVQLEKNQTAFIADPEKALLDLVYLTPQSDNRPYLEELRLQNLDRLDPEVLLEMASESNSSKLMRATRMIVDLAGAAEYEEL